MFICLNLNVFFFLFHSSDGGFLERALRVPLTYVDESESDSAPERGDDGDTGDGDGDGDGCKSYTCETTNILNMKVCEMDGSLLFYYYEIWYVHRSAFKFKFETNTQTIF